MQKENTEISVVGEQPTNVLKLRESGYKVRVIHHRIIDPPLIVGDTNREDKGEDNCVTRREFEKISKFEENLKRKKSWGQSVVSRGGFTTVEITKPDGVTLVGKHNYGRRPFYRKLGLRVALTKALSNDPSR